MSIADQEATFRRWGMPAESWPANGPSTVPLAPRLQRLEQLGVGQEAIRRTDKKTKNARTGTVSLTPNLGYINPDSVSINPRGLQLLRLATGANVKPHRRLTAEEMFKIRGKKEKATVPSVGQ